MIVGHREAALKGLSHADDVLEEVQASIRAARFAEVLSNNERAELIRDALNRLNKNNYKLRDVKNTLNIDKR